MLNVGRAAVRQHRRPGRSLAYGIDRETVNEIRGRQASRRSRRVRSRPGNIGYLEDAGFPEYDLTEAKDLVAQYKEETGGPLTFTLTHAATRRRPQTAQLYQQLMERHRHHGQPPAHRRPERADRRRDRWRVPGGQWRNHPGGDPDTQYVWWYNTATRLGRTR